MNRTDRSGSRAGFPGIEATRTPLTILGRRVDALYLAFLGELDVGARQELDRRLLDAADTGSDVVVVLSNGTRLMMSARSRSGWWRLLALNEIAEGLRGVAELVALLREQADQPRTDVYSSIDLPPGMSRPRFARLCRELARGGIEGVRRSGRVWVAPRALFESREPLARRRVREATHDPRQLTLLTKNDAAQPWSPEVALREAGARRSE